MRLLMLLLCLPSAALAADDDGDGYTVAAGDCDDSNADVHPNRQESCEIGEQIDNDCNGDTNTADGYTTLDGWISGTHPELYIDEDVDGFGTPDVGLIEACELIDGYASNSTDCDDTDAATYPGADEICDGADQDCDAMIDEPELSENSGCVAMFRDQDEDGYGDVDAEVCMCAEGGGTAVHPDDGFTYTVYGGDCVDTDSTIKPRTCTDSYDNDGDGLADDEDPDCLSGMDESGQSAETPVELLDGHDNDCDGLIPAVELDCDDDGALPMLPLERSSIDGSVHPDYAGSASYREAWTQIGVSSPDEMGLAECEHGGTRELTECLGEVALSLECDPRMELAGGGDTVVVGTGLWMLRYTTSKAGYGGRYEGGQRTYSVTPSADPEGDCDDRCPLRYPGAEEECDGVDNNCSDVDPGTDDDGIPDALDAAVALTGSIAEGEADMDNDGALDCDGMAEFPDEIETTNAGCEAITDESLLSDSDERAASDSGGSDTGGEKDDGCGSGGSSSAAAVLGLLALVGLRRRASMG